MERFCRAEMYEGEVKEGEEEEGEGQEEEQEEGQEEEEEEEGESGGHLVCVFFGGVFSHGFWLDGPG